MATHGQAHVCLIEPAVKIVYDGPRSRWEWEPPQIVEGHGTRYRVLRCPFCGLRPHQTEPDDD